jgi:tRNA A37 methylthiotransferase MiaB
VLVEEAVERQPGFVSGRTDNFKHTILPGDGIEIGDIVPVRIESARGATLCASPIEATAGASSNYINQKDSP